MIRTIMLLIGFGLFTRQGARFGDAVLAGNHVLLQLISFSAFFLDGFAHIAEGLIGQAIGRKDAAILKMAVRRSTELAAMTALGLALIVAFAEPIILALSDQPEVVESALAYRYYAAFYVMVSFAAFQLDGVFIGASRAGDMRNASIASLLVFVAAWWLLLGWNNDGLWLAMIAYVLARAGALAVRYPRLVADVA